MASGKSLSSRAVSRLEAQYANKFMPAGVTLESAMCDVRDLIATVRELQTSLAVLQSQHDQLEQRLKDAEDAADDMYRSGIEAGASGQAF